MTWHDINLHCHMVCWKQHIFAFNVSWRLQALGGGGLQSTRSGTLCELLWRGREFNLLYIYSMSICPHTRLSNDKPREVLHLVPERMKKKYSIGVELNPCTKLVFWLWHGRAHTHTNSILSLYFSLPLFVWESADLLRFIAWLESQNHQLSAFISALCTLFTLHLILQTSISFNSIDQLSHLE